MQFRDINKNLNAGMPYRDMDKADQMLTADFVGQLLPYLEVNEYIITTNTTQTNATFNTKGCNNLSIVHDYDALSDVKFIIVKLPFSYDVSSMMGEPDDLKYCASYITGIIPDDGADAYEFKMIPLYAYFIEGNTYFRYMNWLIMRIK